MTASQTERDLQFLYQLGSLRHIQRSWRQYFGTDVATDLEHTLRVAFIALMLAKRIGKVDEEIILKMALVHDLAESLTGDLTPVQKKYVEINEEQAIEDMFTGTHLEEYIELLKQYVVRDTIEAKLVKDADRLDVDLEIQELSSRGHNMEKWNKKRQDIRAAFYTDQAREMWDAVQKSDPSNWRDVMEGII